MYLFLYFMQYLLMGISLSLFFYANPSFIRLPASTRVLVGLCSTPFVLALFTISIPFVWSKAPTYIFLILPLIVSIFILVILRKSLIKGGLIIHRSCGKGLDNKYFSNYLVIISLIFVILSILYILISNSLHPVLGHDALIYFSEAKSFAIGRTLDSIPGFFAMPGEIVAAHPHTFLYQAYIAQALMAGFENNDLAARVASQLTIFFMLIGVMALATTFRIRAIMPLILLVLIVTLSVTKFEYISYMDSRDGFRILAMLLVLVTLLPIIKIKNIKTFQFSLPAFFCSIALAAHTINSVYLLMIWLLLILLLLRSKISFKNLTMLSLLTGIFCIVPLYHYFDNYFSTGHVFGYGMYYILYKGTPLWDAFQSSGMWGLNELSLFSGLDIYFKRYGYVLSVAGIIIAIVSVSFGKYLKVSRNYIIVSIYFLMVMLLPISGWLDLGNVGLKRAMLSNMRYPLMNYSLIGVVIAPSIFFLLKILPNKFYKLSLFIASLSIVIFSTYITDFLDDWRTKEGVSERYIKKHMLDVNNYVNTKLSSADNWVVDRYDISYYSDKKPILIYSKLGRQLFASENELEIMEILNSWNVKVVCLKKKNINWWPKTTFYKLLTTNKNITIHNIGFWQVFTIK